MADEYVLKEGYIAADPEKDSTGYEQIDFDVDTGESAAVENKDSSSTAKVDEMETVSINEVPEAYTEVTPNYTSSDLMEIKLDELKTELETLKKLYQNIEDIMTNSKAEFDRVPNYWQGDCGETVEEDVAEFTENYKEFEEILKNYITHLEDSITEYESINTELTAKADQNLSDQPSGAIS